MMLGSKLYWSLCPSVEQRLASSIARTALIVAGSMALLPLAACHDNLSAATAADADTCYRLPTGATSKKVVLTEGDDNLETCAMHVEGYRLLHRMPTAIGYYEDHVLYVSPQGITASTTTRDIRYSVYTKAEQADLDGKLRLLIREQGPAGNTTSNTTAGANAAGD